MAEPDRPSPDPPAPGGVPPGPSRGVEGQGAGARPASFGNVTEHHWTRARAGTHREAIEYYRARSRAPGVAAGGAERNFYCMECDGVIPHDHGGTGCPHCGAALEGKARRYFNWVEIDSPPRSDAGPLLRRGLAVLALVLGLLLAAWAVPRLLA